MPKDKEKRQINPAAAALKKQKADALRKGKAQVLAQRNERLARRNPDRLQRQIDDLKLAQEGGQLKPKDKQHLEQLERDLKAVNKAREGLGENAPKFGGPRRDFGDGAQRSLGDRDTGVLGKRRRDWKREDREPSSDTDADAKDIPMPKDHENEPPIPRKPRPHRGAEQQDRQQASHALPEKPMQAQITYSSEPQIRNLRKEAVARFVPTTVAARKKLVQGQGRLLEPEEADTLEQQGYLEHQRDENGAPQKHGEQDEALKEEEQRFTREMGELDDRDGLSGADTTHQPAGGKHQAHIEEVDDEG